MSIHPQPLTASDYIAVLGAVQEGRLLSTHQVSIIVAALQRAADMPGQEAPAKPEIALVPALLAKLQEGNDLLREIRDTVRRSDDPAARHARSRLVAMVGTNREQSAP